MVINLSEKKGQGNCLFSRKHQVFFAINFHKINRDFIYIYVYVYKENMILEKFKDNLLYQAKNIGNEEN